MRTFYLLNTRAKNLLNFTLCFLLVYLFSSCSSYKSVPYFQDLNRSSTATEKIDNFSPFIIQKEDILSITVSSLNPDAWNDGNNKESGYLVDENGEIQLPLIGSMKVAGLTTNEIREQVQKALTAYLKVPSVNVRVLNFKVSVFGDVAHPDVYKIQNERVTILDAISLAGDLNITGVRTNVLLIREVDGRRQYVNIDLTSASLFRSPYYYLKNNDAIYVQPSKDKTNAGDKDYRTISLILSVVSVITIILTSSLIKR